MTGRTVIVTGANSGIGRAAASALAGARRPCRARSARHSRRAAPPPRRCPARPRSAGSTSPASTPCAQFAGALGWPDRPADQQRGRDGPAAEPHRRRLRAPVRHQPPRPLRADEPAARARHGPRRDRVLRRPPDRADRLRRPQLGPQALQALARLRPVEARQPAVHGRVAASADRRRLAGDRDRRPSRLRGHQPPVPLASAARCCSADRQPADRTGRGRRRAADAVRRRRGRPRQQLRRARGLDGIAARRSSSAARRRHRTSTSAARLWDVSEQLTGVRFPLGAAAAA